MAKALLFGEVLETIDTFSLEDQETLKEILQRRIIERQRGELIQDIRQAQQEFQAGHCCPMTPEELVQEIVS